MPDETPPGPASAPPASDFKPPADTLVQNRLTQVFKFLKELNELRNPVIRDLSGYAEVLKLDTWPQHPCIIPRVQSPAEEENDDADAEMEPLFRIRRAPLSACPQPPEILDGWLKPGWQSADGKAEVVYSRNLARDKKATPVAFSADPERVAAFDRWSLTRASWAEAEQPAISALKIFDQLHALWTTLQREGDGIELVLADGVLGIGESSICHPVLMQRVNLEFLPSVPEFILFTGTNSVELHKALLRLVPTVEARMIAHFGKELESKSIEPLEKESVASYLRSLVQGLFTDGEYLEVKPAETPIQKPSIWRDPVILLRRRTAGLSTVLESIIADLEAGEVIAPKGLSRIVGVDADSNRMPVAAGADGQPPTTRTPIPAPAAADILFSKPANAEQYAIAARLSEAKAVLVQGPPGTGKTHTIANLLGYLLAQGKTVLVTAHTTKALRVLRGKIDPALQPLCLSVLDSEAESQAQLSRAAQDIASRLSRSNAAQLRREADLLRAKRTKLQNDASTLRRQLRDARFSEVDEIVFGGEGLSPIEVAKRVQLTEASDGWMPGPLPFGAQCPLTPKEAQELYATHSVLSIADEKHLAVPQPELAELVLPADFRLLAAERAGADSRAKKHRVDLWLENAAHGYTAAELQELHQRVSAAASLLTEEKSWLREVLFAGWMGGGLREGWNDLQVAAQELGTQASSAHPLIMEHGPELPADRTMAEIVQTLGEVIDHLEAGGTLGVLTKIRHRGWHQLVELCRVEQRVPKSLEEFRAVLALARLRQDRERFVSRWRRAVESLGGPKVESLGQFPERAAQGFAAEIRARLEWREGVWDPMIAELREAGFLWDAWLAAHPPEPGDHGELARVQRAGSHRLAEVVEAQAALLRRKELTAALQNQRAYLVRFSQSEATSVLLTAQDIWDVDTYEETYRELSRLEGLRGAYQARLALIAKIEPSAPGWAAAVLLRASPHDRGQPPGDCVAAWRWRQWFQELEKRAEVSMADLQIRLDKTEDELRRLAASVVEHETWAAQCERTGLEGQQALMGFVQTIRKIGKGTGKLAPELRRHARTLLTAARSAVPVWIMPLTRVYESFDPRTTKFDVVIIDEASQSDVTALAALYLGCEHIVVGDKEQVTPDAVGQRVDEVQRLIASDLNGIPNGHLYDGQTSIYDLAETAFGGVVALREHFRCVPEIIQFSNHLSYKNIVPLREPNSAPVTPALVAQRVNGFRDGRTKTNAVEAEEVVSLVAACLASPDYARNDLKEPTSFGVISLLGDEQALLIDNLLRRRISPDLYARHRLLCGNAAQFQGDERDVMFLSMVDGPPEDGQHPYRDAGPKDLYKKRYNVAVSRARNQLWVIHSIDPNTHLKSGDLRCRLIEHARNPEALMRAMEEPGKRTDSVFEKLVLQRLRSAGYRVHPQWPVGARRIDLVVEGHTKRLAVECDGEKWHTPEQLQQDLERQSVLERLGWVFVRIRGSVFFRDPDLAMAPVFTRLDQLGIQPLGAASQPDHSSTSPLLERVRQDAAALRERWAAEKATEEGA